MESKKKKKKEKTRRQSRFLNCIQLNWMELICIFYSPIFSFFVRSHHQMHRVGRNAFFFSI